MTVESDPTQADVRASRFLDRRFKNSLTDRWSYSIQVRSRLVSD